MAKNVEYIIKLRDKYSKNLKRADKTTKQFDATLTKAKGAMRALMPVAGFAAGILAFRSLVKVAAGFEKEMANVRAISQANNTEFLKLRNQAEELGRSTAFSAKQAAEGMSFLAMAGFDIKQTMDALPGALNLAAAGSIDLGKAADIASNVLTQFNLRASEMNRVNDIIVKTTTRANTNIEQLAEGLKFTGTTANILKIPLEETSAALGVLANAGLQGSIGGTSLNFALLEMSRASSPTAKKLRKLGIVTHDAQGQFSGLTNILEQFEERNVSATQILDTFGARGGRAMGTLVKAGSEAIKTLTKLNEESEGIAKITAEMKLDNLAGDMTMLKSATQGFSISLGKRMNPAMRRNIKLATNLIRKFEDWVKVPLSAELRKEKLHFNALINTLMRGESHVEARKRAIVELNENYKEYLPNLITEKTSEEELLAIRKKGNEELLKRIRIQSRKELIQEEEKKANEFIKTIIELEGKISEYEEGLKKAREGISSSAGKKLAEYRYDENWYLTLIAEKQAKINKLNEKATKHIEKATKLQGKLIGEAGALPDAAIAGKATITAVPSKSLDKATQTITSAAPKVFNITIGKLIETQEINTTNLPEGKAKIKQYVVEALTEGLNESQLMINR